MNANVLVAKKWHIPFFSERQIARDHFRLNFHQTYVFALLVIMVLSVYYVSLLNQNATKWYNLRSYQAQTKELLFKENLFDIRIAEGRSSDVIIASEIVKKMANIPENPEFLIIKNPDLFLKN